MSNSISNSPESRGILPGTPLPIGGDLHDHVFIDSTTGKLTIQTTIQGPNGYVKHINKEPLE